MTKKHSHLPPRILLFVCVLVALLLVVPIFMRMRFLHLSGVTWSFSWDLILSELQQRFEMPFTPWRFVAQLFWTAPALLIIPIAFFNRVAAALFALAIPTVALLICTYGLVYGLLPLDHGPYLASGLFALIGLVLLPPSRKNEASNRPPLAMMLTTTALFLIWCLVLALGHFNEVFNIIGYDGMRTMTVWELTRQSLHHFLPVFSLFMGIVVIPLVWLRPDWAPRYALAFAAFVLIIMGWNHGEFSGLSVGPVILPWIVLGMATLLVLTRRSTRTRNNST